MIIFHEYTLHHKAEWYCVFLRAVLNKLVLLYILIEAPILLSFHVSFQEMNQLYKP